MEKVAEEFGVPLAAEKSEGPSLVISFLDITIATINLECRLPDDKLTALREEGGRIAVCCLHIILLGWDGS